MSSCQRVPELVEDVKTTGCAQKTIEVHVGFPTDFDEFGFSHFLHAFLFILLITQSLQHTVFIDILCNQEMFVLFITDTVCNPDVLVFQLLYFDGTLPATYALFCNISLLMYAPTHLHTLLLILHRLPVIVRTTFSSFQ